MDTAKCINLWPVNNGLHKRRVFWPITSRYLGNLLKYFHLPRYSQVSDFNWEFKEPKDWLKLTLFVRWHLRFWNSINLSYFLALMYLKCETYSSKYSLKMKWGKQRLGNEASIELHKINKTPCNALIFLIRKLDY